MKVVIPSTTVRAKFLKTMPVGTVYNDPGNSHKYKVEEKMAGSALTKIGVACFGDEESIDIDVPEKLIKLVNPKRCNIMTQMKLRITALEQEIQTFKGTQSPLDKIKTLLEGEEYYNGK